MKKIMKIAGIRGMLIVLFFIMLCVSGCKKDNEPLPITPITDGTIHIPNPGANNDIRPSIQAAVDTAADGDIIVLPAGTFTFSGSITTTKKVSLKGAGLSSTVLYRAETMTDASLNNLCFFFWNINSDNPCGVVISDLTLKSKIPAGLDNLNGSLATDFGIKLYKAVDFRITRCRFENFGYAAVLIRHKDNLARGVIYENEFYHNFKGDGHNELALGYGVTVYGFNSEWISSPNFGSSNFIFIEDNTFEYHRHSVNGDGCGLYVARHNTIKNNLILHAIDMHEARLNGLGAANHFSARAVEVYNNELVNTKYRDGTDIPTGNNVNVGGLCGNAIHFYGGESVIHHNSFTNWKVGIYLAVYPNANTGYTYPIAYQIGYASGLAYGANHTGTDANYGNGDCFVWDNEFHYINGYTSDTGSHKAFLAQSSSLLSADRDYHLSAKPGYTPYTYPHPLRN